jgi:hypothetical protein
MVVFCVTKPVQQTTTISCTQQVKAKFRSPRRFNVLASEDMHRSSYRRSLPNFRKVRFAAILVEVGRPVLEDDEETAAPHHTSLWHSAEDYAAFQADVERIVERYRRGCRSDDLLGLEHLLCPCEEEPYH